MKPEDLKEALRNFTGSEEFTRYSPLLFPNLIITEGLKFLAEVVRLFSTSCEVPAAEILDDLKVLLK